MISSLLAVLAAPALITAGICERICRAVLCDSSPPSAGTGSMPNAAAGWRGNTSAGRATHLRGGSSRLPSLTAYRQRAMACATAMAARYVSTKALRSIAPDAATLMQRNIHG